MQENTLVNKFLGKGFLLDFIEKEMRARWNVEGHFQVSSLSTRVLLDLPSVDIQSQILVNGL